jgi:methionine biosynthesis protein MetW
MTIELRPELNVISEWITPNSRVLDLGCGTGALLSFLQKRLGICGYGLEIDPENITRCIEAGINVIQTDLNAGLSDFDADSFDFVVMTQTLQAIRYPVRLLEEMLRVGRQGIVTFPNFGHWRSRLQILFNGVMPVTPSLPEQWYDTPNIHLCTFKDFELVCKQRNIRILQRAVVDRTHKETRLMNALPNLLGEIALYQFERITE